MKKGKNILKFILIIPVILILAIVLVWRNEIFTIMSIKEIMPEDKNHSDGKVLTIDAKGDYYLDDLLKQGGVKSDKELINFLTRKITKGLFKLSIEESNIGCSSYTASLADGDNIFARNYDMKTTHIALVHTKPSKGRYESISTVDLSFLGVKAEDNPNTLKSKFNMLAAAYTPLDGINEKGLSVGIYMSYQGPSKEDYPTDQNTDKDDITSTILLRLMLDKAKTVEEAIEIAKSYDMHDSAGSSFHYMVADASGNSAILEYIGKSDKTDTDGSKRELNVIYNDKNKNKKGQVVTNFIVSKNYYDNDDTKFGLDRYELINKELTNKNFILDDENHATDILAKVGRRNWDNKDKNTITTHSVIYNMNKLESYLVANEHFGDKNYVYRFKFK